LKTQKERPEETADITQEETPETGAAGYTFRIELPSVTVIPLFFFTRISDRIGSEAEISIMNMRPFMILLILHDDFCARNTATAYRISD
jgi:hypothetical protein